MPSVSQTFQSPTCEPYQSVPVNLRTQVNTLRTTFKAAEKQITLGYSSADLSEMMRTRFSQEIGVFENHTVARGIDTTAWVTRSRQAILDATGNPSVADSHRPSFGSYIHQLRVFLAGVDSETIEIRHHYAWWYPKWLDILRAAW